MGLALAEGATAVTLTTGTSVVAFIVAAITSTAQEAFVKFNVTMAIALTLNFLGFIFFFGGQPGHSGRLGGSAARHHGLLRLALLLG